MNLNKEERLEEVRHILIGSQVSDLHEKIKHLEKIVLEGGAFKGLLERRIANFEESMQETFNLFTQHFELEQTNYKETYQQLQASVNNSSLKIRELENKLENQGLQENSSSDLFELEQKNCKEAYQRLQAGINSSNLKISELEKKLENQSSQEHSPSDLTEVREKLRSLRYDLNYQNIEHKNAYEHLTKSLQEFSREWNTSLTKLEQEAFKRDQALKKYLLTSSTKLSNDLQKLREVLQINPTLKAQPAAQYSQVASELRNLEQKFLRREEDLRLELLEQIKQLFYELNSYREDFSKELTKLYSPAFLLTRLWLWPWSMILRIWRLLNGSKRKENSL